MTTYEHLGEASAARQALWDPEGKTHTPEFRMLELAGEVGEACNVLKKLLREKLEVAGSRASLEDLMDELADVVICSHLVASTMGIKLDQAVAIKFNQTSRKIGLDVFLEVPI